MVDSSGVLDLSHNWMKPGWVSTFGTLTGTINNDGTNLSGSSPAFANEAGQDFHLSPASVSINAGAALHPAVLPAHNVTGQYVKHQSGESRPTDGQLDIGAYEHAASGPADLAITTASLPGGTTGSSYSATLSATGGIGPYNWSVTFGSLPSGLSLNPQTGVISGTPTVAGSSTFTVQVRDSQAFADTDSRSFTVNIQAQAINPVVITTTSLAAARRNKAYSQTLAATGGVRPYVWSVVQGSLPPGLALNSSTGVISGRPTTIGTFSFVVQVRDSQSTAATDTQSLSIIVKR